MKKSILFLACTLLLLSSNFGQGRWALNGVVTSSDNKKALTGAHISLVGTEDKTISNEHGLYALASSKPLPWTIRVDYFGYSSYEFVLDQYKYFEWVQLEKDPEIAICYFPPKMPFEGAVIDQDSKSPLIGAKIIFKNTQHSTITDLDGNFELPSELSFPLELIVSYPGYKTKALELSNRHDNLNIELSIKNKKRTKGKTIPIKPGKIYAELHQKKQLNK